MCQQMSMALVRGIAEVGQFGTCVMARLAVAQVDQPLALSCLLRDTSRYGTASHADLASAVPPGEHGWRGCPGQSVWARAVRSRHAVL